VIGGGDTAMDCVRTAVRQGASNVVCLYRRDRQNMPGSRREVGHAEEEGADFRWQAQPEALSDIPVEIISGEPVEVTERGTVASVRAVRTRLVDTGGNRRPEPQPIRGSDFELPADIVVNALGFSVEDAGKLTAGLVGMTSRGAVAANRKSRMTDADGVFVIGDAWRGPSLVVWAIRDGRDVAVEVGQYLASRAGSGKTEKARLDPLAQCYTSPTAQEI